MAARAVTDFPEPDSPTMPSTSRGANEKLMPRTAWTGPSPAAKSTTNCSTTRLASSISGPHPTLLGIEGLPQAVADEEDAQREDDQKAHREDEQPPLGGGRVLALVDEQAEGDVGRLDAQADVGERGLQHDAEGHGDSGVDDDRAHGVGQHVPEDEPAVGGSEGPGRLDEVALPQGQEVRSDQAGDVGPRHGLSLI